MSASWFLMNYSNYYFFKVFGRFTVDLMNSKMAEFAQSWFG
jgi:hypothetical protein